MTTEVQMLDVLILKMSDFTGNLGETLKHYDIGYHSKGRRVLMGQDLTAAMKHTVLMLAEYVLCPVDEDLQATYKPLPSEWKEKSRLLPELGKEYYTLHLTDGKVEGYALYRARIVTM